MVVQVFVRIENGAAKDVFLYRIRVYYTITSPLP